MFFTLAWVIGAEYSSLYSRRLASPVWK